MKRIADLFALVLVALVFAVQGLTAQTTEERIDAILKSTPLTKHTGQVSVSPDGKWFAWVESKGELRIAARNAEGNPETGRVAEFAQACHVGSFSWSPQSTEIALLAACGESEQQNLYVVGTTGKEKARQVSELKGYVEAPAFSPDGRHVGFLYVAGATRTAGALAAMKPWAGVIGEDGVEILRVAEVDTQTQSKQKGEYLTPANLHVYEYDWRPDGKGISFVAANPPGENNWWVAKLYTEELALTEGQGSSGQKIFSEAKVVLAPAEVAGDLHGLQIAVPRWSPDGASIAFIGGLMSDQGATGGDIWLVSAAGGAPRNLTAGRPATSVWIEWADKEHLYATGISAGREGMVKLHITPSDVNFSAPIFLIEGAIGDGREELSLSSTADHSLFVFTASSAEHAPEMYGVRPGMAMGGSGGFAGLMQLTHANDGLKANWGKVHSLHWKNEGFSVQGWLIEPVGFDADRDKGKKYPLLVIVHGGPASSVESRWGMAGGMGGSIYSSLGYFVLLANPRGSYGQGEAFTQANRKDFGYGDLRDILAGVDAVEAKYPVDDKRVGLTGWSYGGFMSMFAVTQTTRFRAAVAGAGISDWLSYYGENSIDQWMMPYFGASVYDDPAVYAKSSAINFIKQVKTPTLIVVGDRDGECPAPQSFEFWHALRDLGVKTQFVVYPNEGHGFVSREHQMDVLKRSVEWFEGEMKP